MPLLNRKPYQCDASLPEGLNKDEEVFVIEYSKEVFRDYAAYAKKRELYRKAVWSCKYTGKGGLTFQEAQAEEKKALAGLTKFPHEVEEQVVRTVHHSLLPLDKLLSAIYDKLRPPTAGEAATVAAAQQGEQQQEGGDAAEARAAGPAADADNNNINNGGAAQDGPEVSPLAEKENKVQQAVPATAAAQPATEGALKPEKPAEKSGSKKPKAPVARQLLRTFVLEHASQQGPEGGKLQVWVVKPELARKYELPADLPDEVKDKLAAAAKPPKKRPSDAAVASGKQEKKVRKEGGSGKKAAAAAPAAASRPSSASPHGAVASGAPVDMSGEGCRAEGMDDSEPPRVPVKAKSLEEVEGQYKEGTIKHVMVQVLKAHPEGLTAAALAEQAKEMGLADYDDKQKRTIRFNFSNDTNFVRMAQAGVYSLHCFHPELVVLQKQPVPRKRKITEHFLSPGEGVGEQQEGSAAAAGKPLPKVESRVDLGGEQAAEKSGKKKLDKAGKLQADKEQQEEVEEVDGITKAERLIKLAKAAAERHRAALAGAQKAFDEAKKALADIRKSMQLPSPSKARDAEVQIPPEQLSKFEVSAEEREFKGEEGDRKALSEHRQFLQRRVKEIEAQKKAFIEAERAKREGERAKREADLKNSNTQYKAAETALKKREHELAQACRASESATKALAEAERKLAQERKKVETAEAKAKEKEEKEKQRQAEKEERDRRKAEAQAAKRYPIDDLVLLQELRQAATEAGDPAPAADVKPPSWLGGQEQSRLASGLYVSDFLHQFGKSLALKPLSFTDLERVLGAASAKDAAPGDELGAAVLHGIYQRLLQVLLDDLRASGDIGAMERRWRCVLSEGTWPEVLRRYVLTRAHAEEPFKRPNEHVSLAAGMLGFDSADALTHDQHLHLLRFLCDEVLDTEKMRTALQKRADGADDARRDILKEMAEERKKLRVQQEQEREERKRRKEEDKRKQEEEKVAAAAAAADGSAAQDGNAADQAGGGGLSKQGSMDVGAAAAAAGTAAEPSFELPDELREYQGHPDDKKAILQFRQQQQAEKRRLEKERNKWLAEQLRRQREIEAKLKEQREAEKAKQREKEAVEEAISRAQDELEEALERYSTRRLPLGCDRHHRRYWWGLAAHRPAVYVEDEQGRWGAFTTMEEVETLLDSLDRRGVRELALAQSLEKRMGTIQVAIRKAAQAEEKDRERAPKGTKALRAEKPAPQPLRRSGREAQQVEFFNPGKAAGGGGAGGSRPSSGALAGASKGNSKAMVASVEVAGLFGPSELAAFQGVLADLAALEKAAAAAEVAPPATSWADWVESLRVLAEGQDGQKAATVGLRRALQVRLQDFEAAVYGVSDERDDEAGGDEEKSSEGLDEDGSEGGREGSAEPEDAAGPSHTQSLEVVEYVDSDGELSPTKGPRDVAWLWRSTRERSTWQADLSQAGTIARLAYCASVLLQQAEPLLHTLRRAAAKCGGAGGSRGGAAAPAGAVARGAGQPARGSSGKAAGPRGAAAATAAAGAEIEDVGGKEEEQRAAREARRQAREWGVVPADLLEAGAGGVSRRGKADSEANIAAPVGKRKGTGQPAAAPAENVRVTRARKG